MTKQLHDHQHARLITLFKAKPVEQAHARHHSRINLLFVKLFKESKNKNK